MADKNPYVVAACKIVDIAIGTDKYSYPMYQNAPRPPQAEKFAAIRFIASRNPGYDEVKNLERDGKYIQRTEGVREIMIDVLFNRDDKDVLEFDSCFFRPDIQQACFDNNLELLRKRPTNLRTRKLETNWEIRTGITCIFSAIYIDEVVTGYVEEFNINGGFTPDNGKLIPLKINEKDED